MNLPYYQPELERNIVFTGNSLEQLDALSDVQGLLSDERLAEEITAGNVTVAMVRPNLEGNTLLDGDDFDLAFQLESHIQELGIMAKFSIIFDDAGVEAFYGGSPKNVQLGLPPERFTDSYDNRWDEFKDLMTSGPATILLLHSPDGEAIAKWRRQVGHYDIVNRRDTSTLRGTFGTDNYNNLLHGSDSTKAAEREIKIIADIIKRTVPQKNGDS